MKMVTFYVSLTIKNINHFIHFVFSVEKATEPKLF